MFYLQTIKNLYESIKKNGEIPEGEKAEEKKLLEELSRILALY